MSFAVTRSGIGRRRRQTGRDAARPASSSSILARPRRAMPPAAAKALQGSPLAVTERAVLRDAHMPHLAGHVARAAVEPGIQDQPRAEAGAKSKEHHIFRAFSSAEFPFRHGAGVGVVLQAAGTRNASSK